MIKEAIEKILGLAEPTIVDVNKGTLAPEGARIYSNMRLHPIIDPVPEHIPVSTLTGLVDYIQSEIDELVSSNLMIQVDFRKVKLLSCFTGAFFQRYCYITASCSTPLFNFGSWCFVDDFIISLQASFHSTKDRDNILKILGNLKDEKITTLVDDGVSQNVTACVGIAKVSDITLPNPVILQPYRTFLEVEQPDSQFIFRMRSGNGANPPQCALFPADGDMWKIIAIQRIREWLSEKLPDIAIIA